MRKAIRVFPKKGLITDEKALEICKLFISNVRYLENQLQYTLNEQYNFLDILVGYEDAPIYSEFDFEKYQIWELASSAGNDGVHWVTEVTNSENVIGEPIAYYAFDKIEFIGNQETLSNFYQNIYDGLSSKMKQTFSNSIDKKMVLNVNGIYTSSASFDVGKFDSFIPQKVNQIELRTGLTPSYSESSGMESIMFEKNGFYLKEFFLDEIGSATSKTNDLEAVNFFYQNRIIKSFEWFDNSPEKKDINRYGNWGCKTGEWWDNCINSEWIKFFERKKMESSILQNP